MISKRFEANLSFISANATKPTDIIYFETVRRNSSAPLIVTFNNMLIPVRIEGSLVGAIRVTDISHLSAQDLSRIKETVELALEENFVSKSLSFVDELLLGESISNVIQFPKNTSDDLVAAR